MYKYYTQVIELKIDGNLLDDMELVLINLRDLRVKGRRRIKKTLPYDSYEEALSKALEIQDLVVTFCPLEYEVTVVIPRVSRESNLWVEPVIEDSTIVECLKQIAIETHKTFKLLDFVDDKCESDFKFLEEIREDLDFCKLAIKEDNCSFEFLGDCLKKREDVQVLAIEKGWDLMNLMVNLSEGGIDICREAALMGVKNDGTDLNFAPDTYQDDEEICIAALQDDLDAWQFVSDRIKGQIIDAGIEAFAFDLACGRRKKGECWQDKYEREGNKHGLEM